MNTLETLYIDLAEEITSVIERLKRSHASQIALVAPKGAILVQSVVNMKLVRKAAIDASKDVVLVTTDQSARTLAERIGLIVAENEAEVPLALGAGTNQDAMREVSGVRIHRYYEETDTSSSETEVEVAPLVPKNLPTDESSAPIEEVPVNDLKPTEELVVEKAPLERKPLSSTEPVTEVTHKPAQPLTVKKDSASTQKKRRLRVIIIASVSGLVLVSAIIGAYIALPLTKITITVQGEAWEQTLLSSAGTEITETSSDGSKLPAEKVTASKQVSSSVAATGTKQVGTQASGTATVYNNQESSAQTLTAGSVITANGQRFITSQAVSVPGVTVKGGQIIPGSATVGITAESVGEAGNMKDVLAQVPSSKLYGVISETTGGTSKTVTIVSAADIQKGKDAVATLLKDQLANSITEQLANRTVHSNADTDAITLDEPSLSVPEGTEATELLVEQKGTRTRVVIDRYQAEQATSAYLASQKKDGTELQLSRSETTLVSVDATKGTASLSTAVFALERPIITTTNLANQLTGLRVVIAEEKIRKAYEGVTVVTTITPNWWPIPTLPRNAGSITIETRAAE